ncbi:MAG: nicotinate (nicotinamide) nucleotide adenylyltransferase [Solirubrobacteraceae bacterium]
MTTHPKERLGILGGMFNPPHLGHLALAHAAASDLGLSRVLLMPVLIPPHKPAGQDPGAEHRLRMCRLAVRDDPRVGVCTLELQRPGPSYTVDTLRSIHASDPDAELTLIVGADVARTLASWREPREILKLARLAVAERDSVSRGEVLDALLPLAPDVVPGSERGTVFVQMPAHEVSSSMVRERVAQGAPIDGLVSAEVGAYIAQNELYRTQTPASGTVQEPLWEPA